MVLQRKLRPSNCTYNWTRGMQLANTPPLQSTTPGLHPVSFHQMAPPMRGNIRPITAYYSVYRPQKDERLSRPGWLVTYRNKVPPPGVEPGHVTHPSTNRARRRVTLVDTTNAVTTTPRRQSSENFAWAFVSPLFHFYSATKDQKASYKSRQNTILYNAYIHTCVYTSHIYT